jgi:hypothetical protein
MSTSLQIENHIDRIEGPPISAPAGAADSLTGRDKHCSRQHNRGAKSGRPFA